MQRFDKDGDGTLSEEERAAAKQEWENRKSTMLEKFDADGDGTLNVEERREAIKQARLNRESLDKKPSKEAGTNEGEVEQKEKKPGKGAKKKGKRRSPEFALPTYQLYLPVSFGPLSGGMLLCQLVTCSTN